MTFDVPAGKYVLGVSGGVDSVVLLHLLADMPDVRIVVAHFDHGIRPDSGEDLLFVRELAQKYGVVFESDRGNLGSEASEAEARAARYAFLRKVQNKHEADAIITAHHQDDVLETMILNMLRGTGRRGLDPMRRGDVVRPLLHMPKAELVAWARSNGLTWREDSTNTDQKYLRNYVRHSILPRAAAHRAALLELHRQAQVRNDEIDALMSELDGYILNDAGELIRQRASVLPFAVLKEYLHHLFVRREVQDVSTEVLTRAAVAVKTLPTGKRIDLGTSHWLVSKKASVQILSK